MVSGGQGRSSTEITTTGIYLSLVGAICLALLTAMVIAQRLERPPTPGRLGSTPNTVMYHGHPLGWPPTEGSVEAGGGHEPTRPRPSPTLGHTQETQ